MFRGLGFDKLLSLARALKKQRRTPERRRTHLMLEVLESRSLLSVGNSVQQMLIDPPAAAGGIVAVEAPMAAIPTKVNVTANNATATYSTGATRLTLIADVDGTKSTGTVNFTITDKNGKKIGTFPPFAVQNIHTDKNGVTTASATATLPAGLAAGTYTISVKYSDTKVTGKFVNGKDTSGTLTINPQPTRVRGFLARAKVGDKTVKVSAEVTGNARVNVGADGTVTFTFQGKSVTANLQNNSQATATLPLPAGLAKGKYQFTVSYTGKSGNFADSSGTGTLIINAAVKAKGNQVGVNFSNNPQTATVSASVTNPADPSVPVNEGDVTFSVPGIGTVEGEVVNGQASASLPIPAGEKAGSYAIDVSYSDPDGVYFDGGDTDATLTINSTSCGCMTVATAQNEMIQAFAQIIGDIDSLVAQFVAVENNIVQAEVKFFVSDILIPLEELK